MKVFVPRNIEKGWLNMHFQVGPLSVSLIQLVLVAVGAGAGLLVFNTVVKTGGSKAVGIVLAIPLVGIFLFVAFFKMSELTLLPFIAKIRRTRFLDTTKKFQTNSINKPDELEVLLKASHVEHEEMQKKEQKTLVIDDLQKKPLSSDDLLS